MSTPPHDCGSATGLSPRYAFLRHLNTNTLALILFVALALVGITPAKELQNDESAHARDIDAELAIRLRDTSFSARQEIHALQITAKIPGIKRREFGKDR